MAQWIPPTPPPTPIYISSPSTASTVSLPEDQEDRESTGSQQSPSMTGPPIFRRASITSEDNWNQVVPDTDTGSN